MLMKLEIELTEQEAQRLRALTAHRCADCMAMLEGGIATAELRQTVQQDAELWGKLLRPLQVLPGPLDTCASCSHFEEGRSIGRCELCRDLVSCMAPPCPDFKRRGW